MSDDVEQTLFEDVSASDGPESRSEVFDYTGGPSGKGGVVIFPYGTDYFADEAEILLIRIKDEDGSVEVLSKVGYRWEDVTKARSRFLKSVKTEEQDQ